LAVFFCSVAFIGYLPVMPGTFGTLAGIPLCLAWGNVPWWGQAFLAAIFTLAAIGAASRANHIFGRHDDQRIVIDEVAGYLVTMIGITPSAWNLVAGFVVFRIFDILKPWPCRTIDRKMPGGAGVVLDDIMAGIYGLIVMQIATRLGLWS
jgi:phosphatidylglycerophosphatase A